jgi:hypothetical protein
MEGDPHRFAEPRQCIYWASPEQVRGAMAERFELVDTYVKDSHWWRYLLKCRECGQLYFFEFYEQVDWEGGNDPQYSKYIPIAGIEDVALLKDTTPIGLLRFTPSLNIDFPKEAKTPKVYWAKNQNV